MEDPDQIHYKALVDGFKRLQNSGSFTDVTINVGQKTFRCHKALLTAISSYFDTMFSSDMREKATGHVTFPTMDPELFEKVLHYIYTGDCDLNTDNVVEILRISSFLRITSLQTLCEEFLKKHLSWDNCFDVFRLSVAYDCKSLRSKSADMVAASFKEISKSDKFLELEANELADIINSDYINISPEEAICDIVIKWIQKDESSRAKKAGILIDKIRLSFLKPEYLVMLREKQVFQADEKCRECLNDAIKYSLLPARQQEIYRRNTRHRIHADLEEVIVVVGGCATANPPYARSLRVICYSFIKQQWYELCPLPYDPGIEFATCTYGNDIFVSGGGSMQKSLLRYDSSKNVWSVMSCLKQGRRRHTMQAITGYMFALGGYDNKLDQDYRALKSVEMFSLSDGAWEFVGDLPLPVSSCSSALIGNCIYVFGGEDTSTDDTSNVQCFDTRHKQSYLINFNLPLPCKLTKAIVVNSTVYLILYDGRVTEFIQNKDGKPNPHLQDIGDISPFKRIHFGAVHYQGKLVITGGKGGDDDLLCDDVIIFDPHTDECEKLEDSLPIPQMIEGCVKISVHKKYMRSNVDK